MYFPSDYEKRLKEYKSVVKRFVLNELENKSHEEITKKYIDSDIVFYILDTEHNEVYMSYLNKGQMLTITQHIFRANFEEIFYILQKNIQAEYGISLSLENVMDSISRNYRLNIANFSIDLKERYESACEMYFNKYKNTYLSELTKNRIDVSMNTQFQLIY